MYEIYVCVLSLCYGVVVSGVTGAASKCVNKLASSGFNAVVLFIQAMPSGVVKSAGFKAISAFIFSICFSAVNTTS